MNPYKVLGVREGASQEEIKAAYRELVKKYHPDKYANNPLGDLAAEKMKEINEAYDMLTKGGYHGSSGGNQGYSNQGYGNQNYGGQGYGSNTEFARIRSFVNAGNIGEAERLLDAMSNRGAEWHYLKGVVLMRKGWYDQAYQHLSRATQLDPYNMEYRSAFQSMANRQTSYRNMGTQMGYGPAGMSSCDCCSNLLCADCCCECMGGDLISCC
ncbi:MAG: tetratricopeptide repeat protein [Ruminococcaceae bacterium]|nr:tetratricopeptide repeat protein [Oscillospiraceae bacterium]